VISRRAADRPRVDHLLRRLRLAASSRVQREAHRLEGRQRELVAMDPHGVLRRGYSITMKRDGRLIRSVAEVSANEPITTRLADGTIDSIVGGSALRKSPRRHAEHAPDQLDLFSRPSSG